MNKKHLILITAGVLLWFTETAYFGWNAKPESGAEAFLDSVSLILVLWGILGDLLSGLTITKTINIKENHDHMQSDKLYLQIKKGATLNFGDQKAETKKDINAPLTKGFEKESKK